MTQPSFWCIDSIIDEEDKKVFLCVDRTGVYVPELVVLMKADGDWAKYDICLEPLTRIGRAKRGDYESDSLSDNVFHPTLPAWFGTNANLQKLASFTGSTVDRLICDFLSSSPKKLSTMYLMVADYFGYENFGNVIMLTQDKAEKFVTLFEQQIAVAKTWHDGYGF